ncbi:MAG: ribonuclease H-like domain-containing protein, partial [Planctomycetota bacterium]
PAALPLEEAVAGRVIETARGEMYFVREDASRFLDAEDEFTSVADLFFRRRQANRERLTELAPALECVAEIDPENILFLDIETVGFHGMGLFLIGLLRLREGRFQIEQLFARNYAEEASILEYLASYYSQCATVVTFNGRAFDLPFVAERAIVHRVELPAPPSEIDLLHISRRLWKDYLPNCRLVTLEQLICGRRRTGDLPSHLIPKAYHDYVQTGDARLIADVIRHNAYDLVTMAHLLAKIANG